MGGGIGKSIGIAKRGKKELYIKKKL